MPARLRVYGYRFQSTPSYGGRPLREIRHLRLVVVSIHALVRRATAAELVRFRVLARFQSTPSYGGRRQPTPVISGLEEFQSTPSYGGRRWMRAEA